MGVPVKPDERCVGQRVPHVPRVAVDEVVLAAVRLVCNNYDVAAVRKHRVGVAALLREELLDGGEDHAARRHGELGSQVRAALCLRGRLAQQVLAAGEGGEELLVQVIAVREDDDGGVSHRWLPGDGAGVEGHGKALSGALRVPHDTDAMVAWSAAGLAARLVVPSLSHGRPLTYERCGPQRLVDGGADSMELVVPGHLLEQRPAVVLEHDEVVQQRQQTVRREHALHHHLELRGGALRQPLAGDGAPGLEPLAPGGQRTDARRSVVGHHQQLVHGEEGGQLRLVGLKLLPRCPDGGVLIQGVLKLHDGQGQAVDEEDDVRAAGVAVLRDGELVDGEEVVVVWAVSVHDHSLSALDPALRDELHGDAGHKHAMEGAVADLRRRPLRPCEFAVGVVQRLRGQAGIEPREGCPQATFQHHVNVVISRAGEAPSGAMSGP